MNKLYNILYQYQPYLLGLSIFLLLSGVSFTVKKGHTNLIFENHPLIIVFLVGMGLLSTLIYIRLDVAKMEKLKLQIVQQEQHAKEPDFIELLNELTDRQLQVYQLIISGKTNKEIVGELFIEASTLKTHINQIYKKLQVRTRKELKIKAKAR